MNKTIQSNSYRSYSKSLLALWIDYFDPKINKQLDKNFLVSNLHKCLDDFQDFASAFDKEAWELAKQDKVFKSLSGKEKENFHLWLNEKISKALDVYWAPLSQAATQYTSPAYKRQLDNLINLESQIEGFLDKLNQFVGTSDNTAITINDVLLFFDELTLIRVAPYTKTALIGIPFRVIDSDPSNKNMLAGVAHELGHFLYWRLDDFDQLDLKHNKILDMVSELLKNKIAKKKQLEIRYIKVWFEELFADFIGASIAKDIYKFNQEHGNSKQ